MSLHSYINRGSYGYRGQVTAKLLDRNNRVLCSHRSHNGGTKEFFKNLNSVLSGKLSVDNIQPRFLVLYKVHNPGDTSFKSTWEEIIKPVASNSGTGSDTKSELPIVAATQLLPLDSWLLTENSSANSSTKLQIKIPFTYITEDEVYIFALYPASVGNLRSVEGLESKAIAYYKLVDSSDWKPFSIDKTARLNSLAIEWDLTFFDAEDDTK